MYHIANLFFKALLGVLILLLAVSCFVLASDTDRITGKICEKDSNEPISGVTVMLVEKKVTVLTDASGRYKFDDVVPGVYTLSITAENYEPVKREVRVESGKTISVDFQLKSQFVALFLRKTPTPPPKRFGIFEIDEIVITGKQKSTSVPSKVAVTSSEIKRIPGTGGDVLKAIQALPGISTMGDFSGQLYVRGGGPEDNSFYFDQIALFYPYHFGGFSSTLNADIIKQIDVYAGGFDAKYGDSQAVIDIFSKSRSPVDQASRLKFNLNMLMAEGLLEGTFGEKSSWYLAGRRSYIDLFPIKTDVIVALPRFWDYQTKLSYKLTDEQELSFTAFGSDDFMKLKLEEEDVTNDPDLAGIFHWRSGFHSQAVSLRSTTSHEQPRGLLSTNFTFSHNYMLWDLSMGKDYFIRSTPHIYNLRGDANFALGKKYSVETGFNAGFSDFVMKAYFVRPPTEEESGYPSFTDSEKVRSDIKERSFLGNAYAQLKYVPIEQVILTLGGRGDYYDQIDEFAVSPRASLSLALSNGADLKLACGKYVQPPQANEADADWGNPDVSSTSAFHYILELERRFSEKALGKVAVYYKQLDELITPHPEKVYLNQGEGFVRGFELFLRRKNTDRFFGWLSYAYSLSKRKDRPNDPWRLYTYDQTHVLTAVANYKLTQTWELGGKWHYSTGTPYTPVLDAEKVVDSDTGEILRWVAIFDKERNSKRLTPYHRLDLRVAKAFKFKGIDLTAYLELMNAYNHKNMMAISYNEDYTEEEKAYSLPIIPYFGMTADF